MLKGIMGGCKEVTATVGGGSGVDQNAERRMKRRTA